MIQKHRLHQITYADFGEILEQLTDQIKVSGLFFDLLVPILRSGGFTGLHLASKLKMSSILPVQYKYVYKPSVHIMKKFEQPKLHDKVPARANILIVDSNTVQGRIARQVIADVRAAYPAAKIYFASAVMDVSCVLEGVEQVFIGLRSNEARAMTQTETVQQGITNDITIFPWENLDEQWQEINAQQSNTG